MPIINRYPTRPGAGTSAGGSAALLGLAGAPGKPPVQTGVKDGQVVDLGQSPQGVENTHTQQVTLPSGQTAAGPARVNYGPTATAQPPALSSGGQIPYSAVLPGSGAGGAAAGLQQASPVKPVGPTWQQQQQAAKEAWEREQAAALAAAERDRTWRTGESNTARNAAERELAEKARLAKEADDLRWTRLQEMLNKPLPGEGGGTVLGTPGAGGAIGPKEEAARAAAFARAKEQSGQIGRASLTGLRESLASRNMLGGGAEAVGTAAVHGGTAGQLGDFTREQLLQDLDRSSKIADRDYAGNLTKRNQDLTWRNSLLGLLNSGGGRSLY